MVLLMDLSIDRFQEAAIDLPCPWQTESGFIDECGLINAICGTTRWLRIGRLLSMIIHFCRTEILFQ